MLLKISKKNSIKLLTSPFTVMLQTFFTRRALKGNLGTQMALEGNLATHGTRSIEHSKGSWALEGQSSTQGTSAFWHSSTSGTRRALKRWGFKGTRALSHSKGTWKLEGLKTF